MAVALTTTLFVPSFAQAQQKRPPARTAQRTPEQEAQQATPAPRAQKPAPARVADKSGQPAGQTQVAPPAQGNVKVLPVQEPFTLTADQQQNLDTVLDNWEQKSNKIKTFKCEFSRWDYDPAFGHPKNQLKAEGSGSIKYKAPDRGDYQIEKLQEWDAGKNAFVPNTETLDHWICDGESIYEFVSAKKQLIERKLPPNLRGKAIVDGPLPFIFSAKADQLKSRYWMRDVTPAKFAGKEIWLEAFPKRQQDAANVKSATIILTSPDFVPYALQIVLPDGKSNTAYEFKSPQVNDPLSTLKLDFMAPRTPLGWKRIVEDPNESAAPAAQPEQNQAKRPADQSQAKRPATPTKRK